MRITIGMSGGVDSSVVAALLHREGHEVTGVFIRGWTPEGVVCTEREDRLDAMRVAAHLGIPFKTFDAREEYKKRVADAMLFAYKQGSVPNPDILCNQEIKFGTFYDWALSEGADAVATGHYARVVGDTLLRGVDKDKDQSYFLYTLTKEQLAHILFPLGGYTKKEVREIARKYKLPVADKPDSQGVCFIGKVDMAEFLSRELGTKKGDVLTEEGVVVGEHNGAHLYTLGARHGFTIVEETSSRAVRYVISKNMEDNTLTVGARDALKSHASRVLSLSQVSWVSQPPHGIVDAQYRYHGPVISCQVKGRDVHFLTPPEEPIPPGQSLVFYTGDVCLGGGVVEERYS